jgi:nicotinamidase-related amidase
MEKRTWHDFFTEQDKRHDEMWGKQSLNGFGEKPVFVMIDMYYSVVGLKREDIFESMKLWPMSTGLEGWAAIDKTVELLASARKNGIPVIHVKGMNSGINHWTKGSRRGRAKTGLTPEMIEKGRQIVDEVKPIPGEIVIEKAAASAFHGTPLLFQLISLNADTVICAGETTSGCVRASVVDGATYRFQMGVVEECVYDRTQASHYMNLYDLHQKYADVVSLDYAMDYFDQIGAAKKVKIEA